VSDFSDFNDLLFKLAQCIILGLESKVTANSPLHYILVAKCQQSLEATTRKNTLTQQLHHATVVHTITMKFMKTTLSLRLSFRDLISWILQSHGTTIT